MSVWEGAIRVLRGADGQHGENHPGERVGPSLAGQQRCEIRASAPLLTCRPSNNGALVGDCTVVDVWTEQQPSSGSSAPLLTCGGSNTVAVVGECTVVDVWTEQQRRSRSSAPLLTCGPSNNVALAGRCRGPQRLSDTTRPAQTKCPGHPPSPGHFAFRGSVLLARLRSEDDVVEEVAHRDAARGADCLEGEPGDRLTGRDLVTVGVLYPTVVGGGQL